MHFFPNADSIDTPTVMKHLRELIGVCNIYCAEQDTHPNCPLLETIATYCTRILQIFGIVPTDSKIGYPLESTATGEGVDVETLVVPFASLMADFREEVRTVALQDKCMHV